MKKFFLLSLLVFLACHLSFSQQPTWQEMMFDPDANFFEVQAAAEAYFETNGTGKSSGWKPYKRWEYYHSHRIKPDGALVSSQEVWDAVTEYQLSHPADKRSSASGDWRELGPITMPANGTGQPNGMGRIAAIAFHPTDPNVLLAGSASGGVWKSADNGASWAKISDGLTRLGVSSIVIHPTVPNTIYIGTGDRDGGDAPGYGVWRSIDGGVSWTPWNTGMGNRTVYEILMHPSNPNILVASTNGRVYRSTNGGMNWTLSFTGHNLKDIAFKPGDPNIVYASGTRFYRSIDNGQSFTQVTAGVPNTSITRMAIAVSPDQPNWVYLFVSRSGTQGFEGMYRSTNSGLNFTQQSTSPNLLGYDPTGGNGNQGWYDLVVTCDPTDADILYTGAVNVWKSTDAGVTWSIQTHWYGGGGNPSVHADDHVLEWSPHSGDLYLGHDGGIHRTDDAGASWEEISSGLAVAQVYKIGQSATVKDLVINGYQDNGTAFYREGNWYTEIGGDGMECIVDYTDANVMYGALYYGDVRRSINGGTNFSSIARNGLNGITETGGWVTPYKLHPTDPNTMFLGMDNVWRTNNVKDPSPGNVNWTRISNFATTNNLVDIAIAPSNPNVMYASKGGSQRFHKSTNAMAANPTWTNLHSNLPVNSTPKDIEIHPTDPNTLWIALGNDIYKSTDGGNSFTNVSGTLPNISLNTICLDINSPQEALYVGMDLGVYYLDNTLADWVSFSTGLANVEVTELEIYYDPECGDDVIRAGTYGRGLWESDLRDPGNLAPVACYEASPTTICEGATVKFVDKSSYTPTSWNWTITPLTFSYVNGTSRFDSEPEVQFNAAGTYTISLAATNANGTDIETKASYITVSGSAVLIPLVEDFETGTGCNTTSDCGNTSCVLPGGWTNEVNGTEDDIDWRMDNGGTPSGTTGPSIDANPGNATGLYAYLEASGCYGQVAHMISPCLDLRTVPTANVVFSAHLYGIEMGTLHLDVLHRGVWIEDIMPVLTGNIGNAWQLITVSLDPYVGSVIQLRFRGITGPGYRSDMAIDNIQVDGGVLATTLLNVTGTHIPDTGNQLRWEVESPVEGDMFELKRMDPDGTSLLVAEVSATLETEYNAVDAYPLPGRNTYLLSVYDQEGRLTQSQSVEVYTPVLKDWVRVYPNPFDGILTLEAYAGTEEVAPLAISDLRGRRVLHHQVSIQTGINRLDLDLREMPQGIYFVNFKGETHKMVKK